MTQILEENAFKFKNLTDESLSFSNNLERSLVELKISNEFCLKRDCHLYENVNQVKSFRLVVK